MKSTVNEICVLYFCVHKPSRHEIIFDGKILGDFEETQARNLQKRFLFSISPNKRTMYMYFYFMYLCTLLRAIMTNVHTLALYIHFYGENKK